MSRLLSGIFNRRRVTAWHRRSWHCEVRWNCRTFGNSTRRKLFPLRTPCILLIRSIWWLILINQLPKILFSTASRTFISTICPAEVSNYFSPSQGPDVSAELVVFRSAVRPHLLVTTVWIRRNFNSIYPFSAWGELLILTWNLTSLHIRWLSPKKRS